MEDVLIFQVIAEILISLAIVTTVRFHFSLIPDAVAIETILHVGHGNVSIESQCKVLVILWSFLVLRTKVKACNR